MVARCDAVRKIHGTPRQRGGWHAHEHGMFCSCPLEMYEEQVVFQKWRWTEIAVTLGLIFVVSLRKEWPMTFIAVRCPQ